MPVQVKGVVMSMMLVGAQVWAGDLRAGNVLLQQLWHWEAESQAGVGFVVCFSKSNEEKVGKKRFRKAKMLT